jgi:hypothetical protein
VLTNNRLRDVVLELGNEINDTLQLINDIHAYNPDNDLMNRLLKELRGKSTASLTKGNPQITTKAGGLEIIYAVTANGYRDVMKEAINYYTNALMAIMQVMEIMAKLGVDDDYVVFMDGSTIDVVVGYSMQDLPRSPLLQIPNLKEKVAIESLLGSITGLRADEIAGLINAIDNAILTINNNSLHVESAIKLDSIEYPSPFKELESRLGGGS